MDFMEKITELRAEKGKLLQQAESLVTDGKFEEADQITAQMEAINGKIASDQLADCPLTFRDLEAVVQSFLTVIAGMNHHRISYPDEAKALNTAIAAELGAPAPVLPAATAQPAEKEAE